MLDLRQEFLLEYRLACKLFIRGYAMRKKAHYGYYGLPVLGLVSGLLITAGILIGIFESIYPGALVALAGAYLIISYFISFFLMERRIFQSTLC